MKRKCKKRAFAVLMIVILLLAFTGSVVVSTQVVQAEETEAETEAETARDIINPDDMTGVSKITGNIIVDFSFVITEGLSWLLKILIGDVTDIILQTGNGVTKFYCFSFAEGNVYGVIAAIAYSLMRGIAFLVLAVELIYAIVQAIVGVSTGVRAAQLKASIGTIATSFFVLALAPMLMTHALNIRNQITGTIITEIYGRGNTDFGQAVLSACQGAPILGCLAYVAFFFFCIRMAIDYANVALSCVVGMMSLPFCCMLGPQSTKMRLANWLTMMTSNLLVPIIDALLISVPCLILQLDIPLTQQIGRAFCMIVCCWGIQPARMWLAQAIGVHGSGALQAGGQFARAAQELWRDTKNKASDFMEKLDDAKEQNQKADEQEALAAAAQGAAPDALSDQNTYDFDGTESAGVGGSDETVADQNADNQNANVAPEVGNMLDNQVSDDVTDKAAELNEPEVTGQKDETESTEKAAGNGTGGQATNQPKDATENAGSTAVASFNEQQAAEFETSGQKKTSSKSAATDAAEATVADAEANGQTTEQTAEQQTEETATFSENSEQGEESSATTDAAESTATDIEAGGQDAGQNDEHQADQSANTAQGAENYRTNGSAAESKKSGKLIKKEIPDIESDTQSQDTDRSAGTDSEETTTQSIGASVEGDSKTGATDSGAPDSGQVSDESAMEGTDSQESGASSDTDTQQDGAYDGFTTAGIGALPQDESGLVAMQGNLEQQEQQAKNDIILMKRSRRRFNKTKQALQQQKATNDSEYRIREAGLQSQIAEANLAEEKAKATCLAQGGKPNDDPDVQAYRQTSKSLSEDLKNMQTDHQVANAALDKQIQTIDTQIAACDGAIEDTSEQVAQIQDAKAQVQDARRVISQATGQRYQASAAAASVQIAQNQALASRATLDNFEQPQIYAALSPEQRADFHRQKAKDIRKTAGGQLVGGIGGAIAGAAAGSMAGGVQGSIIMGQIGSDIGSFAGGAMGTPLAVAGAAVATGAVGWVPAIGGAVAAGSGVIAAASNNRKQQATINGTMPLNSTTNGTASAGNTSVVQSSASAPQPMTQQPINRYQSRASQFSNYRQPIVRNSMMLTPQDRQQYFEQQKDNFNKYYANYKEDYMNTSGKGFAMRCLKFSDFNGTFDPASRDDPKENQSFYNNIQTLAQSLKASGFRIGGYNPMDKGTSAVTAEVEAEKMLRNAHELYGLLNSDEKRALAIDPIRASKDIAKRLFSDPQLVSANTSNLVGVNKMFPTLDARVQAAIMNAVNKGDTSTFQEWTANILQLIDFSE